MRKETSTVRHENTKRGSLEGKLRFSVLFVVSNEYADGGDACFAHSRNKWYTSPSDFTYCCPNMTVLSATSNDERRCIGPSAGFVVGNRAETRGCSRKPFY